MNSPSPTVAAAFPHLLAEWDYTKNTLDPTTLTYGSSRKVWWKCSEGHEWLAEVCNRTTRNHQCRKCALKVCAAYARSLRPTPASLVDTHPELAVEWSTRNQIPVGEVSRGSRMTAWWRCPNGHEWQSPVKSRTKHHGKRSHCPTCSSLAFLNPAVASEWHEKNPLTAEQVRAKSRIVVWWKCAAGHEWRDQVIARHVRKHSVCRICIPFKKYNKVGERISRNRTVTRVVQKLIRNGISDYTTLLEFVLDGIKSGDVKKPASALILHSIIKANLMELHYTGFKNWRAVGKVYPQPKSAAVLDRVHTELGIPLCGAAQIAKLTGRPRGRPRKYPLGAPVVPRPPKRKRYLSEANKVKMIDGLKAWHARRKISRNGG